MNDKILNQEIKCMVLDLQQAVMLLEEEPTETCLMSTIRYLMNELSNCKNFIETTLTT